MAATARAPGILVVEDETLVRQLNVLELEEAGYVVLEAENAADAIAVLEGGADVALLFTDVNMPGTLDGLDLARLVHKRWPKIRLLVTSGGGQVAARDVPDDGRFVPKPYSFSRITQLVQEMAGAPS